jgi:hypothetical protein
MSLPIRLKLETGVFNFVKARAIAPARLASVTLVSGHASAEPDLPYLVIYCGGAVPHPDMAPELGIKLATVIAHLKTHATDEERARANDRLEELETLLMQPLDDNAPYSDDNKAFGRLLASLNKPAGADTRPAELRQFHAYDFYPADDNSAFLPKAWHDQLVFSCVCQGFDSH